MRASEELTRFAGLIRQGLARADEVAATQPAEVRDLARAHYLTDWFSFLATHMEQSAGLARAVEEAIQAEDLRRAAAYETQTRALFPDCERHGCDERCGDCHAA